ncbi:amino acid adenylation domain-containing protein [Kitasatospora viridis]|uniref:Amino acid adenylation domain-containing protein n=1 Tax=Kitasatospora viridis TaxID=281105 RepID=A0A561UC20_9ACTN|nr:amino acid adenylation domain-containing protein [Kitasatospora viridis]TWF96896.1 amino acid adenylation domain-containing protein [Kitasatospora viridis]
MFEDGDDRQYLVVRNHEEQYSVWPVGRELPAGWQGVGVTGDKAACLAQVKEVWTDLRPLSLRRAPRCLHQLFGEQAALRPDAVAVRDDKEELTYRQLDERSDRLASALLREVGGADSQGGDSVGDRVGDRVGSRVGLHLRRGNAVLVAVLAVLKAGLAYVPLDPAYPAERVRYMAEDAAVDLVLTDADSAAAAPEGRRTLVLDPELWAADAPAITEVATDPDAPAYVIYTSGSSGTPKGVEVSHRNVTALLRACEPLVQAGPQDVWTLFHSYCFDFSVWEIWGALAHGGTLLVVSAEAARSPEALLALLRTERVTVLNQVPSVFRHLSRTATLPGTAPLPDLRYVIFGGEAVDVDAVREWRQALGTGTEFINMYGITETTVFATGRRLLPAEIDVPPGTALPEGAADPGLDIGSALDGFELAVLTADGSPAAVGELGEIHLAGPQLAIGYLGRPELTAERYPVLTLPGRPPRRYYRSGDLALVRPDGVLEYAGRADDQVKINGYRIEIGEVETVLRAAPGVGDLVVVPVTSQVGEKMLAAFFTAQEPGAAQQLAAHARAALPGFMVPGRFVEVPELPLSPSGKTDKRALTDLLSAKR